MTGGKLNEAYRGEYGSVSGVLNKTASDEESILRERVCASCVWRADGVRLVEGESDELSLLISDARVGVRLVMFGFLVGA